MEGYRLKVVFLFLLIFGLIIGLTSVEPKKTLKTSMLSLAWAGGADCCKGPERP